MVSFCNGLLTATSLVLLVLGACSREGSDEMSWARAALERNSRLEVVAADRDTRTFTVRLKDSGELRMVRLDQLIAAPPVAAQAAATAAAPGTAPAGAAPANVANSAGAAGVPATAGAPAATPAARLAAPAPTQPASLAPQTGPSVEAGPGRVLESGPGYTIKAAASTAGTASGVRDSAAVASAPLASAPLERRHDPIVCQGARLLHLDNRNVLSDGDAVSAEDGCEVYITNSRIRAAHVGVSARRANVHIDNSLIEGDDASIEASEGAQVYAGSSRFKGLSRRLDTASFHDLGGNVWH